MDHAWATQFSVNQPLIKRRVQLNEERLKLLNAHYQGAIPVDLLKTEQDRITRALEESEQQLLAAEVGIDRIESTVRRCMKLLKTCYETYITASPQLRRLLNQSMFEAFSVGSDGEVMAKPTEAFLTLLRIDALRVKNGRKPAPEGSALHDSAQWQDGVPAWLADAFKTNTKKRSSSSRRSTPVFSDLGLNDDYSAEGVGFEPTVPCDTTVFETVRFGHSRIPPRREASRPGDR